MFSTLISLIFAAILVIIGAFVISEPQTPNKELNIGITVAEAQKFADEYRAVAQKHEIRKSEEMNCLSEESGREWKLLAYLANYKENTLYKFSDSNGTGYAVGRECRWNGNSTAYLVHECFIIQNGGGKPCMHFQWTGYKD